MNQLPNGVRKSETWKCMNIIFINAWNLSLFWTWEINGVGTSCNLLNTSYNLQDGSKLRVQVTYTYLSSEVDICSKWCDIYNLWYFRNIGIWAKFHAPSKFSLFSLQNFEKRSLYRRDHFTLYRRDHFALLILLPSTYIYSLC